MIAFTNGTTPTTLFVAGENTSSMTLYLPTLDPLSGQNYSFFIQAANDKSGVDARLLSAKESYVYRYEKPPTPPAQREA